MSAPNVPESDVLAPWASVQHPRHEMHGSTIHQLERERNELTALVREIETGASGPNANPRWIAADIPLWIRHAIATEARTRLLTVRATTRT